MRLPELTYESNVPYALRFMIEFDIVGMGWIELKNYTQRLNNKKDDKNFNNETQKISSC